MFNLSENYHLRKCYLDREQVPTQSMIRKKMTPALAAVYFNSMTPKLKEIAGLEPSLKGGGKDWYVPPEDLLEGQSVLKPIRKEVLAKLNNHGIDIIGTALVEKHRKAMDLKKEKALLESDINWRNTVIAAEKQLWADQVAIATKKNSAHIINMFNYFTYLYKQSLGKIEILFHESAIAEIKNTKEKTLHEMRNNYTTALKYQSTLLYDIYDKKLKEEKIRLKSEFIQKLEICRTAMADKIHDLNVDKHMAIEKLRQCLQCQNLACEIYVALKEREECFKETEELTQKHRKTVRFLSDTILAKDFEIHLAEEKEKKRQELRNTWQKKVCHVVKRFQMFVSYCLNMLPEHAEFFINMEKLMLLQVNEALEDPTASSIFSVEKEQFHTPVPRPKPFYLFCDKGYKAQLEQDLCPKHSGTSSPSQLPAIIINKRCLYAACNNFEQFSNKVKEYLRGNRGDDTDMKDNLVYENFVPVKYTSSQQLLEIKLESSLLQVLQQEMAYMQTDKNKVPIKCSYCGLPWCLCSPCASPSVGGGEEIKPASSLSSPRTSSHKISSIGKSMELDHEREPKWDSFFRHIEPKKCSCAKTAKKHLAEHLPAYMKQMKYGPPDLPDYEMCSVSALKALVKKARKEVPLISPVEVLAKTKDTSTQCYDPEFENLCTCFNDSEVDSLLVDPTVFASSWTDEVKGGEPSYMEQATSSFAKARAYSLRKLLEDSQDLVEIFSRKNCAFE